MITHKTPHPSPLPEDGERGRAHPLSPSSGRGLG
jgi:hypothetical protein